jgi:hypothetical protein
VSNTLMSGDHVCDFLNDSSKGKVNISRSIFFLLKLFSIVGGCVFIFEVSSR